jgi:HSP20 family protein
MAFPDIKTYREDRRLPMINPDVHSRHFLGQSVFDLYHKDDDAPVNVRKNEGFLSFDIALPGFSREDISVEVRNDTLIVKAKRQEEEKSEGEYIVQQFRMETVEKRFLLQPGADREEIKAKFKNGLLTVSITDLPPEEEKPVKRVTVE